MSDYKLGGFKAGDVIPVEIMAKTYPNSEVVTCPKCGRIAILRDYGARVVYLHKAVQGILYPTWTEHCTIRKDKTE